MGTRRYLLGCRRRNLSYWSVIGENTTIAAKPTWHENLVWIFAIAICNDVGALERLWKESKDVVDNENTSLCGTLARLISLQAVNRYPASLLLVVMVDHRRHGAASVRLS